MDYYFIMNVGVNNGGETTHAIFFWGGEIVSSPKGYDVLAGIGEVESKLHEEVICSQMKELDIALENVPVNTDFILK